MTFSTNAPIRVDMLRSSKTPGGHLVIPATLALFVFATPVSGQDRRSGRVLIRSEAVLWLGDGLDWVLGGRVGVGYRF